MDKKLEISSRLAKGEPYNKIVKELKVSAKTVAKVSKLIDSGVIKIDKRGRAYYAKQPKSEVAAESQIIKSAYDIMRALGRKSIKEALNQAYELVVEMNPYVLHYGLKSPSDLIKHLESRIQELTKRLNACENQDELSLARKLGIRDEILAAHQFFVEYRSYPGSIGDFLSMCAYDALKKRGWEIKDVYTYKRNGKLYKCFSIEQVERET